MDTSLKKVPVSILVITFNEEENLEACLKSVVHWASEIFVVDSFSTDLTCDVAKRFGAQVFQHKFDGHGAQRNWALANLPFKNDWVLALDADHRVSESLAAELGGLFANGDPREKGFFIKRRQIFRGRWIRHGGYYPKFMLKLFNRKGAHFDEEELDDRVYLEGFKGRLKNDFLEDNTKEWSIGFWIDKHNAYAEQAAKEELKFRSGGKKFLAKPKLLGNPQERVFWFKSIWYRMPLYWRPLIYFVYRYFLRLGILDGKEGFIFHFLQAFWFRLLVDIKLEELLSPRRNIPTMLQSPQLHHDSSIPSV